MSGGYLSQNLQPKSLTTAGDLGTGQVETRHVSPPLFLELQLIKLHTHEGTDSAQLGAGATPEMVRGFSPREREEHGVAPWAGGASATGSIALTFATPFLVAPQVYITAQDASGNIITGTSVPTTTGVTIYWRDATGATHTTMNLAWLAKGR